MEEAEYCHRVALIDRGRLIEMATPSALKQRNLGGDLLVLECDAIGAAMAALQTAPGLRDVAVFGNSLHVVVDDAASALELLPRYLVEHGIPITRIEPIQPSIEDIFVQMVGSEDSRRGARP